MCKVDKLHKGYKITELSEASEDNEVFSVANVRERFECALKCDDGLEKKIAETIESVQKDNVSAKKKFHSLSERHTRS